MKNPEAYLESLIDLLDTSNNNQEVASNVFKNKLDMQEKYMGLVPDTLLDFIVNQFRPGMTYKEGDMLFKKYSTFSQGGSVTTPKRGLVNEPGSYGGAKGSIFSKTQLQLDKLEESVTKSNNSYKRAPYAKELLKEAGFFYKTSEMSPATGEEAKKILSKLLTTEQKIEAYVNNVMLQENSFLKDFESPFKHIQNKFGTSTVTLANWAKTSQAFKDNETLFKHLANQPSVNKYKIKPDGSPRTIFEYSDILQNKLPSSKLNLRGNNAVNFILQSAERNYSRSKTLGKEASVTFVTNPETTPINQWQFIDNDTNRLFSVDPTIDEVLFKGTTYKNNYLNNVNAEKLYAKEFGGVYKMFNEDLPKYLEATFVDKDGKTKKVDTALRQKYYSQTGKKDFLMRRASEIDHLDLLNDPFGKKKGNLRLIGRFENTQAGSMRNYNKYIDDPKLKKKVLKEIGYSNSDKNVDNYISRVIQTINDPLIKIKGGATFITTPEGRLAQKNVPESESKGIKDLIKKIGCPNLAAGGRVGFETGADCYSKGVEKINLGKIGKGAEARNFAKLFTKARTLGRNLFKFGIVPEAFFIAGETSIRVGMGNKIGEAFGKATSFLPGGTARENAATKAELERILGKENASIVLAARKYQKAKDDRDNVIKSRDAATQYVDEGETISGFGGRGVENIEAIKDKYKLFIDEAEKKVKLSAISGAEEDKARELENTFTDISGTKNIFSQFLRGNRGTKVELDASGLNYDLSFPEITQEDLNKKAYTIKQYYPRELMILSDDEIRKIFSGESNGGVKAKYMIDLKNEIKNAPLANFGEQLQGFNIPEIVSRKNQYDYVPADYGTYASGGIASLTRTIPPERGPNSQGLASLKEYDKQY